MGGPLVPDVPISYRDLELMLADRGVMAILLVEQYYDFAQELADEYLVMERGEVIARGQGKDMEAQGVRQLVAI